MCVAQKKGKGQMIRSDSVVREDGKSQRFLDIVRDRDAHIFDSKWKSPDDSDWKLQVVAGKTDLHELTTIAKDSLAMSIDDGDEKKEIEFFVRISNGSYVPLVNKYGELIMCMAGHMLRDMEGVNWLVMNRSETEDELVARPVFLDETRPMRFKVLNDTRSLDRMFAIVADVFLPVLSYTQTENVTDGRTLPRLKRAQILPEDQKTAKSDDIFDVVSASETSIFIQDGREIPLNRAVAVSPFKFSTPKTTEKQRFVPVVPPLYKEKSVIRRVFERQTRENYLLLCAQRNMMFFEEKQTGKSRVVVHSVRFLRELLPQLTDIGNESLLKLPVVTLVSSGLNMPYVLEKADQSQAQGSVEATWAALENEFKKQRGKNTQYNGIYRALVFMSNRRNIAETSTELIGSQPDYVGANEKYQSTLKAKWIKSTETAKNALGKQTFINATRSYTTNNKELAAYIETIVNGSSTEGVFPIGNGGSVPTDADWLTVFKIEGEREQQSANTLFVPLAFHAGDAVTAEFFPSSAIGNGSDDIDPSTGLTEAAVIQLISYILGRGNWLTGPNFKQWESIPRLTHLTKRLPSVLQWNPVYSDLVKKQNMFQKDAKLTSRFYSQSETIAFARLVDAASIDAKKEAVLVRNYVQPGSFSIMAFVGSIAHALAPQTWKKLDEKVQAENYAFPLLLGDAILHALAQIRNDGLGDSKPPEPLYAHLDVYVFDPETRNLYHFYKSDGDKKTELNLANKYLSWNLKRSQEAVTWLDLSNNPYFIRRLVVKERSTYEAKKPGAAALPVLSLQVKLARGELVAQNGSALPEPLKILGAPRDGKTSLDFEVSEGARWIYNIQDQYEKLIEADLLNAGVFTVPQDQLNGNEVPEDDSMIDYLHAADYADGELASRGLRSSKALNLRLVTNKSWVPTYSFQHDDTIERFRLSDDAVKKLALAASPKNEEKGMDLINLKYYAQVVGAPTDFIAFSLDEQDQLVADLKRFNMAAWQQESKTAQRWKAFAKADQKLLSDFDDPATLISNVNQFHDFVDEKKQKELKALSVSLATKAKESGSAAESKGTKTFEELLDAERQKNRKDAEKDDFQYGRLNNLNFRVDVLEAHLSGNKLVDFFNQKNGAESLPKFDIEVGQAPRLAFENLGFTNSVFVFFRKNIYVTEGTQDIASAQTYGIIPPEKGVNVSAKPVRFISEKDGDNNFWVGRFYWRQSYYPEDKDDVRPLLKVHLYTYDVKLDAWVPMYKEATETTESVGLKKPKKQQGGEKKEKKKQTKKIRKRESTKKTPFVHFIPCSEMFHWEVVKHSDSSEDKQNVQPVYSKSLELVELEQYPRDKCVKASETGDLFKVLKDQYDARFDMDHKNSLDKFNITCQLCWETSPAKLMYRCRECLSGFHAKCRPVSRMFGKATVKQTRSYCFDPDYDKRQPLEPPHPKKMFVCPICVLPFESNGEMVAAADEFDKFSAIKLSGEKLMLQVIADNAQRSLLQAVGPMNLATAIHLIVQAFIPDKDADAATKEDKRKQRDSLISFIVKFLGSSKLDIDSSIQTEEIKVGLRKEFFKAQGQEFDAARQPTIINAIKESKNDADIEGNSDDDDDDDVDMLPKKEEQEDERANTLNWDVINKYSKESDASFVWTAVPLMEELYYDESKIKEDTLRPSEKKVISQKILDNAAKVKQTAEVLVKFIKDNFKVELAESLFFFEQKIVSQEQTLSLSGEEKLEKLEQTIRSGIRRLPVSSSDVTNVRSLDEKSLTEIWLADKDEVERILKQQQQAKNKKWIVDPESNDAKSQEDLIRDTIANVVEEMSAYTKIMWLRSQRLLRLQKYSADPNADFFVDGMPHGLISWQGPICHYWACGVQTDEFFVFRQQPLPKVEEKTKSPTAKVTPAVGSVSDRKAKLDKLAAEAKKNKELDVVSGQETAETKLRMRDENVRIHLDNLWNLEFDIPRPTSLSASTLDSLLANHEADDPLRSSSDEGISFFVRGSKSWEFAYRLKVLETKDSHYEPGLFFEDLVAQQEQLFGNIRITQQDLFTYVEAPQKKKSKEKKNVELNANAMTDDNEEDDDADEYSELEMKYSMTVNMTEAQRKAAKEIQVDESEISGIEIVQRVFRTYVENAARLAWYYRITSRECVAVLLRELTNVGTTVTPEMLRKVWDLHILMQCKWLALSRTLERDAPRLGISKEEDLFAAPPQSLAEVKTTVARLAKFIKPTTQSTKPKHKLQQLFSNLSKMATLKCYAGFLDIYYEHSGSLVTPNANETNIPDILMPFVQPDKDKPYISEKADVNLAKKTRIINRWDKVDPVIYWEYLSSSYDYRPDTEPLRRFALGDDKGSRDNNPLNATTQVIPKIAFEYLKKRALQFFQFPHEALAKFGDSETFMEGFNTLKTRVQTQDLKGLKEAIIPYWMPPADTPFALPAYDQLILVRAQRQKLDAELGKLENKIFGLRTVNRYYAHKRNMQQLQPQEHKEADTNTQSKAITKPTGDKPSTVINKVILSKEERVREMIDFAQLAQLDRDIANLELFPGSLPVLIRKFDVESGSREQRRKMMQELRGDLEIAEALSIPDAPIIARRKLLALLAEKQKSEPEIDPVSDLRKRINALGEQPDLQSSPMHFDIAILQSQIEAASLSTYAKQQSAVEIRFGARSNTIRLLFQSCSNCGLATNSLLKRALAQSDTNVDKLQTSVQLEQRGIFSCKSYASHIFCNECLANMILETKKDVVSLSCPFCLAECKSVFMQAFIGVLINQTKKPSIKRFVEMCGGVTSLYTQPFVIVRAKFAEASVYPEDLAEIIAKTMDIVNNQLKDFGAPDELNRYACAMETPNGSIVVDFCEKFATEASASVKANRSKQDDQKAANVRTRLIQRQKKVQEAQEKLKRHSDINAVKMALMVKQEALIEAARQRLKGDALIEEIDSIKEQTLKRIDDEHKSRQLVFDSYANTLHDEARHIRARLEKSQTFVAVERDLQNLINADSSMQTSFDFAFNHTPEFSALGAVQTKKRPSVPPKSIAVTTASTSDRAASSESVNSFAMFKMLKSRKPPTDTGSSAQRQPNIFDKMKDATLPISMQVKNTDARFVLLGESKTKADHHILCFVDGSSTVYAKHEDSNLISGGEKGTYAEMLCCTSLDRYSHMLTQIKPGDSVNFFDCDCGCHQQNWRVTASFIEAKAPHTSFIYVSSPDGKDHRVTFPPLIKSWSPVPTGWKGELTSERAMPHELHIHVSNLFKSI